MNPSSYMECENNEGAKNAGCIKTVCVSTAVNNFTRSAPYMGRYALIALGMLGTPRSNPTRNENYI